jgi:chromosome segregation ATPase
MDNLFVWIVMFAGAAIALLGMFLVASEKELKVKRREIEGLLTRLENVPEQHSSAKSATTPRDNSAELAELHARNQDLQNQLNTASGKLELGRAEVNELRNLLQASEAQVTGSAADNQDAPERHARLQSEMLDLKQRLEESQAKLREHESQQQKLATVDELEARHREERQRLESRIAELEKDVATRQEKVRELEILQDRLAESERNQETLRSESRRH